MSTSDASNGSRGKVRFALVGAGVIGRHHGKVMSDLADQIDLVAVVDHSPEKASKIATERGGTVFTSLTEALAGTDVDIVVVCTPTGAHGDVAIEALQAGASMSSSRSRPK